MVARTHDPRRLDVAALAADAAQIEGCWPLAGFARLCDEHPADAPPPAGEVRWRASGERRTLPGAGPQVWLHLQAMTTVWRICQRCLQPVALPLEVRRSLQFVADETLAAELDADSEDDVLALERALDLHALVEDELLLALPMVPRHDACPQPLPSAASSVEEDAPHPFAALEQWRGKTRH